MSGLHFEKKNQEDYEHNSKLIAKAIREIEKNPELKPTITQVAGLTGLHRNTLSKRSDLKGELQQIKKSREDVLTSKESTPQDEIGQLKGIVENAKSELVFWYTKVKELEHTVDQLSTNLEHMSNAKNYYMEELKKMKQSRDQLAFRVDQLTDLLHMKNGVDE